MIVGANGCGKSTLLRGMARLVTPVRGAVLLDGKSVHHTPSKEVARVLGLLPQAPVAPEGITVTDLVGRGRYPHQGWFRHWSAADDEAVAHALAATGTTELADRRIEDMSGGQRQRVWIAMALAQETDLLLLDEPTTYLDLAHQIDVLDLLTDLNAQRGTTIVVVMHDLNLACRYADHMIAMADGAVAAQGPPRDGRHRRARAAGLRPGVARRATTRSRGRPPSSPSGGTTAPTHRWPGHRAIRSDQPARV